jgi:hypothetical protein
MDLSAPVWRVLVAASFPLAGWLEVPAPAEAPPAASATPAPPPAELAGRVELKLKEGHLAPAEGTVVWVDAGAPEESAADSPPVIVSRDKRFAPHVVAVPRGATVAFPNVDPIFHNAFSRTPGSEFDLGLYRRGARRSVRMNATGLVHAVTGEDGAFVVRGIPPGRRLVRLWNEKGGQQESTLAFRPGARQRLDAVLDATAYRPLPHKNKFGRDYPPVTQDVDRY